MKYETYKKLAPAALGKVKADLIFKNCRIVDVFTGEVVEGNIGVKDGIIIGVSRSLQGKKEIDLNGAYIAPGFMMPICILSQLWLPRRNSWQQQHLSVPRHSL